MQKRVIKSFIWTILVSFALSWQIAPARASIADCKIKNLDNVSHQEVGWPRDPDTLPSKGKVKFLILAVDFEDSPASNFKVSELPNRLQLATVSGFYNAVSNEIFQPIFDLYPSVVRLPKNSEKYGDSASSDVLVGNEYASHLITHDALNQIESKLDINQFLAVIVVVTGGHSLSGQVALALSTDHVPEDKVPGNINNEIVLGEKSLDNQDIYEWRVIVHEINHLLGIPDLYLYSKDGYWQAKTPGPFGQLGYLRGESSSDSLAYNRWIRGWLAESQVLCVKNLISSKTFQIQQQKINSGKYELILYRISDTKVIAFESPRNKGFASSTYPNSILIYSIDSEIPVGEGPVRLIAKVNATTSKPLSPSLPDWERFKTAALLPGDWVKFQGMVFVNKPLKTIEKYVDLAILTGKDANPTTITCVKKGLKLKKTGYFLNCPTGYTQI